MFVSQLIALNRITKIIHIESDSFILTNRLCDFINILESGWHALYSYHYNLPETCIQIICRDQLKNFIKFARKDYEINFSGKPIELKFPFTNICKDFIGDRYFDFMDILPCNIDYVCNVPNDWRL